MQNLVFRPLVYCMVTLYMYKDLICTDLDLELVGYRFAFYYNIVVMGFRFDFCCVRALFIDMLYINLCYKNLKIIFFSFIYISMCYL